MSDRLVKIIAAIVAVIPVCAVFAHKSVAPAMILMAFVSAIWMWDTRRRGIRQAGRISPAVIVLLCLVAAWAAVSALWAPDAEDAAWGAVKMIGNFAVGGILLGAICGMGEKARDNISRWLAVGWVVAVAVIVFELLAGSPLSALISGRDVKKYADIGPFWLNNGISILVLLFWPVASVSARRFGYLGPVLAFLILIAVAAKAGYLSGVVALIIGAGCAALYFYAGKRAAYALAVTLVAFGLSAPAVVAMFGPPVEAVQKFDGLNLPHAGQHRVLIWSFVAQHIAAHPVRGWGMNASKFIPGGNKKYFVGGEYIGPALPLHPHNATLQFWLELGLPGAVFYLALAVTLILMISRFEAGSAYAMGQLFTALTIAHVSFGVWQAWWLAALWLAAACTVAAIRPPPASS